MIIKYCPFCAGAPYTKKLDKTNCPICSSVLRASTADASDLLYRSELVFSDDEYSDILPGEEEEERDYSDLLPGNEDEERDYSDLLPGNEDEKLNDEQASPAPWGGGIPETTTSSMESIGSNDKAATAFSAGTSCLCGKVSQYSNTLQEGGKYKRFIIIKLWHALVYRQRFEDILHRFTLRVPQGQDAYGNIMTTDVVVNAHGTIADGATISDNAEVEVIGKYCGAVFMASEINVVQNGCKTPVKFQHSKTAILYGILAIVALLFLIYIGVSAPGGFFQNIGSFLKTWLITFIVVTVLYFIAIFSKLGIMFRMATGKQRKFPFVGLLLVSLVIALIIFYNFGIGAGIGSVLGSLFSSILEIAVMIVILFIICKLLLGLF